MCRKLDDVKSNLSSYVYYQDNSLVKVLKLTLPSFTFTCGVISMASSWMENPTNKDRLLLEMPTVPAVSGVRITTQTSLLSYAAGGALSPIRLKQPGALLGQFA